MPRRLQKTLRGFSGYVGSFEGGNIPLDLSQTLVPTLEMEDWLGPNKWAVVQDAAVPPNNNISITVPDAKFWRLKWVAIEVTTPAATSTNMNINLVKNVSGATLRVPLNPLYIGITGATGGTQIVPINSRNGYGVRVVNVNAEAGDFIEFDLLGTSGAGNSSVTGFVQYQEIDV